MDAQVSGLRQAARNANDGISMLQTFEGASKEITTMLNRMRDLTVQALNGTYDTTDIASLGDEYTALNAEINRVIDATQWNGMAMMDTGGIVNLQIGANSSGSEVMAVNIMDWDSGAAPTQISDLTGGAGQDVFVSNATNVLDGTSNTRGKFAIGASDLTGAGNTLANGETFKLSVQSGGVTNVYEYKNETGATLEGALLANTLAQAFQAQGVAGYTVTYDTDIQTGEVTGAAQEAGVLFTATSTGDYNIAIKAQKYAGGNAIANTWSNKTIADLDNKIAAVTAERAKYGAYISRLESASDNLLSVAQNTDASRGQIEDADYAAETTELARTQIIAQAGTAMLAQANQIKQSVLALLK
jgi:flagellin